MVSPALTDSRREIGDRDQGTCVEGAKMPVEFIGETGTPTTDREWLA